MKRLFSLSCAVALGFAFAQPALAADSPWNGSWKLNQDKSRLTGETFSYAMTPDGRMHYSNGSSVAYDFACDGKPYPTLGASTVACTTSGPSVYTFNYGTNGKAIDTDVVTLSADGGSYTDIETTTRPDGMKETSTETYARVAGTSGLAGTWKTVKSSSDSSFSFTIATGPTGMTVSIPAYQESIALAFDGSPSPVTGPTVSPGSVWIAKRVSPSEFTATSEIGSKALTDFDFRLEPDGKTITLAIWAPGKENEKRTLVYDRQ